jgi:hypothetical protein
MPVPAVISNGPGVLVSACEDHVPENYHTLRYERSESDRSTAVALTHDGCDSVEQAEQCSQNWQGMLDGPKKVAEAG